MTTVRELQEMLAELDPDLPIGTLVADAGTETNQNQVVSFELFGFAHTTVVRDTSGRQRAAWLLANNLLAPSNDQRCLAEFHPPVFPARRPDCGCLVDLAVGLRSTVALCSQPCPHNATGSETGANPSRI